MRRRLLGLLVACLVATGCGLGGPGGTPQACDAVFSATRCWAMAVFAANRLAVEISEIARIDVIPEPTPKTVDGRTILLTRSGGPPVEVIVHLRSGDTRQLSMECGGIATGAQCLNEPRLWLASPTLSGYFDIPCAGEPPAGCATPVPPPDPAGLADAQAVHVDRLDIPIDHVGDFAVSVGEARLPNGVLTEASFALLEPAPRDVVILSSELTLHVRSLEPGGRSFWNVYEHGWREGAERVAVTVDFHVDAVKPGASISVVDIVVR